MAPINGKPFCEILLEFHGYHVFLELLLRLDINSNCHQKLLWKLFLNGRELAYSTEKRPLGTGGAAKSIKKSRPAFVLTCGYAEFDPKLVVNEPLRK